MTRTSNRQRARTATSVLSVLTGCMLIALGTAGMADARPSARAAKSTLTVAQAKAAAQDKIHDAIGADGTLDSLRCTRRAKRHATCRGTGTMFMAGMGEHGFIVTAAVRKTKVRKAWRTTVKLTWRHTDPPADSGSTGGDHNH